jgi:hypothetical protein
MGKRTKTKTKNKKQKSEQKNDCFKTGDWILPTGDVLKMGTVK